MTKPLSDWQRAALSFGCGLCGAMPGHKCRTITGKAAQTPHSARTDAASANGWRPADDWRCEVCGAELTRPPTVGDRCGWCGAELVDD